MEKDLAISLSEELKKVLEHTDKALDELANAATKITHGLETLADVAGRIRRNIEDPPAVRHTLDIHDTDHGLELEKAATSTDPEPS